MQYHIQTAPIWDAFKNERGCPLCGIYGVINERLVNQYLNEAVMEPAYRVRVNKLGFCTAHSKELYAGKNKLGLALQLHTRTEALIGGLKHPANVKSAKKEAERIKKELSTCVICESADEMMTRYAYTVAQMYAHEKQFPDVFKASSGFCLLHYALLLENAHRAGAKAAEYLSVLCALEENSLIRVNADTERFTQMFDYNSTEKGMKGAPQIVPDAINKLRGKIL